MEKQTCRLCNEYRQLLVPIQKKGYIGIIWVCRECFYQNVLQPIRIKRS